MRDTEFPPDDPDAVVDVKVASRLASISPWALRDLVRAGRGPAVVKFGIRKLGFRTGDLRQWIRSRVVPIEAAE